MKNFYAFLFAVSVCTLSYGQISEGFESGLPTSGPGTGSYLLSSGTWEGVSLRQESNAARIRTGIGALRLRRNQPTNPSITTPILSGAGTVSFWLRKFANGDASGTISLQSSTDGTTYTTLATQPYSVTTYSQLSFPINNPANLTIRILSDNAGRIVVDDFEVTAFGTPATYTFTDGTWSPSDPNGNATVNDDIIIASGNATISNSTTCNTVTVNPGASLTVDTSVTLSTADATNGLTLESTSNSYSSLISDGTISGTINYERHVNSLGSGAPGSGGNDLIALPLMPSSGLTFNTFIALGTPNNASKLATNGTFYAFAPYNNTTQAYENFTVGATDALVKGKGYRAATNAPDLLLTFSGVVEPNNVSIPLSLLPGLNQWNLVGNPYPSYLSSSEFLSANAADLDPTAQAIYGYNANTYTGSGDTVGNFTIINNVTNTGLNIAPGQGFFVAGNPNTKFPGDIVFNNGSSLTTDMRTLAGSDDFIEGRQPMSYNLKLDLIASNTTRTSFYFNENSSLALDPSYDAAVFGTSGNTYPLFSHLVEGNTGRALAIQSLNITDLDDVTIALGVNANQGEQVTFSISDTNLPSHIEVYLEDNLRNTLTPLTNSDYVLTPTTDVTGIGRFFLKFSNSTLSTTTLDFDHIKIYTTKAPRAVNIKGLFASETTAKLFDINGRLLHTAQLDSTSDQHSINVANLADGIYIIKLNNDLQERSQKVILK